MNRFSVCSVWVTSAGNVLETNFNRLSSIAFFPGWPVPIEMKHFTSGFNSPVSSHQISDASPSISSTGLLAPRAPSANLRAPIDTGSKKVVAADVARAAWQMVAEIPGLLRMG